MARLISFIIGVIFTSLGLLGFFKPNLMYLVQFDLFQSFCYLVIGALGLKISLDKEPKQLQLKKYLTVVAVFNLVLMMLGLIWPNLGDIFHLEIPEHFFHAGVGLISALTADYSQDLS